MNSGERLWWGAGGAAALLVGLLIGIWIGGKIEEDAILQLISSSDLTQECREQLHRAAAAIIEAWEGASPEPN